MKTVEFRKSLVVSNPKLAGKFEIKSTDGVEFTIEVEGQLVTHDPSDFIDQEETVVIFRKFKGGDVIALMPSIPDGMGLIQSYQRIGQHGSASPQLVQVTKLATEEEYAPLKKEMEEWYGYRLKVQKRINWNLMIEAREKENARLRGMS
jgi:hypothetical protein